MQITINIELMDGPSLQHQIFESIRRQILDGHLKTGSLLPSTRDLSQQLGVSRNTVTLAYNRLIVEDYIFTRKTVGTFVNEHLPESFPVPEETSSPDQATGELHSLRHPVLFKGKSQDVVNPNRRKLDIDFWVGRPDPHTFPTKAWRRILLKNLSIAGSSLTEYSNPVGILKLRQAIAEHLGPARGIKASANQIIIVNGIQEGLNLVSRLLIKEGTQVVTECPCYQGAAYTFESYGARINPVPVDNAGMDVEKLPLGQTSLAYVTPSHQYPMGGTLSLERRLRLWNWASATGAYIVEDDYDSDFRYNGSPLMAIAGQDRNDCVIYMGTFSKSIGAGLRLGYLVMPKDLVEPAKTVKTLMDNGHSYLDQAIIADFISSGFFAKHLRSIRHTYLIRRNTLVDSLQKHFGQISLSGLDGGMHIAWYLPKSFPAANEVQALAEGIGVGAYSMESAAACHLCYNECSDRIIVLGYSSLNEGQIREGIARLAGVLQLKIK